MSWNDTFETFGRGVLLEKAGRDAPPPMTDEEYVPTVYIGRDEAIAVGRSRYIKGWLIAATISVVGTAVTWAVSHPAEHKDSSHPSTPAPQQYARSNEMEYDLT